MESVFGMGEMVNRQMMQSKVDVTGGCEKHLSSLVVKVEATPIGRMDIVCRVVMNHV